MLVAGVLYMFMAGVIQNTLEEWLAVGTMIALITVMAALTAYGFWAATAGKRFSLESPPAAA